MARRISLAVIAIARDPLAALVAVASLEVAVLAVAVADEVLARLLGGALFLMADITEAGDLGVALVALAGVEVAVTTVGADDLPVALLAIGAGLGGADVALADNTDVTPVAEAGEVVLAPAANAGDLATALRTLTREAGVNLRRRRGAPGTSAWEARGADLDNRDDSLGGEGTVLAKFGGGDSLGNGPGGVVSRAGLFGDARRLAAGRLKARSGLQARGRFETLGWVQALSRLNTSSRLETLGGVQALSRVQGFRVDNTAALIRASPRVDVNSQESLGSKASKQVVVTGEATASLGGVTGAADVTLVGQDGIGLSKIRTAEAVPGHRLVFKSRV